ncbi:ankyrin repeat-containing domain protein [Usnea florida]
MYLVDLPSPALQCIIEHMVAIVGLYKAMRLRSICKLFYAEVTRAIFWTSDFTSDDYRRCVRMTPECVAFLLKGNVARAGRRGQNPLSFAISKTIEALLDDAKDKTEDKRLVYSSALCDAVAYTMDPRKVLELLKTDCKIAGSEVIVSQHILAGAAAIGGIDQVQQQLSIGPNEHLRSAFFGHAMQNAARTGRADILNLLIQNKANTPLDTIASKAVAEAFTAACASGHTCMVQLLLSYSKANAMDLFRPELAISVAARNGHLALVETLLQRFNLPHSDDLVTQAAFAASSRGYPQIIQMLLKYNLRVNAISNKGQNLLHHAARGGHARVVQLLLDHGVSYYEGRRGDPLYLAAINGHQDVVQLLLDHGADFKSQGCDYCVLKHAAKNREAPMIRFLVKRGLDFHAHTCADFALEFAAECCDEETVRLLVGMGANVDGWDGKNGPICRAKMKGQLCVVNALLELGAKNACPYEFWIRHCSHIFARLLR